MKASRFVVPAVVLALNGFGNNVCFAQEEFGTGLKLPPLETLKKQIEYQGRVVVPFMEADRRARADFQKQTGKVLPDTALTEKIRPSDATFDWSALGKVTPVKNQQKCGSCWVFGALGAFEGNYCIRNNVTINASEQDLLDSSLLSSCDGGWAHEPLTLLMVQGAAKADDAMYRASKAGRNNGLNRPYKALMWGFVGNGLNPTPLEIKSALLEHGPLAVTIRATRRFQEFRNKTANDVFREIDRGVVNHFVTLVGWNDTKQAWKIKNSWGTDWGNNGFAWVGYDTNQIGYFGVWVESRSTAYPQPTEIKTSFEGDIGGVYGVKLENGTACVSNNNVSLAGTVSIWPKQNPALKATVRNASLSMSAGGGASNRPAGVLQGTTTGVSGAVAIGGRIGGGTVTGGASTSMKLLSVAGSGDLELRAGDLSLTISQAGAIETGADGALMCYGGDVQLGGCTYQLTRGMRLLHNEAELGGSFKCGNTMISDSTLRLTSNGVSGTGKMQLFGHTFDMTYAGTAQNLTATGNWAGANAGWQKLPANNAVEYRVNNPTLKVSLNGAAVTSTFDTDKVEVQTVAKNKNNEPYARAELNPDPVTVAADGSLGLPLPALPQPQDINKTTREACEKLARDTYKIPLEGAPGRDVAVNVLNAALKLCTDNNPAPPAVPTLPHSISVKVEVVVK